MSDKTEQQEIDEIISKSLFSERAIFCISSTTCLPTSIEISTGTFPYL